MKTERLSTTKKTAGFTLLEVMVALAIFAVCASVVIKQSSISAHQYSHIKLKTLGAIKAKNTMASLRIQENWPAIGTKEGTETEVLDQDSGQWLIKTVVSGTTNENLRKVEVNVLYQSSYQDQNEIPLSTLIGFIGKY